MKKLEGEYNVKPGYAIGCRQKWWELTDDRMSKTIMKMYPKSVWSRNQPLAKWRNIICRDMTRLGLVGPAPNVNFQGKIGTGRALRKLLEWPKGWQWQGADIQLPQEILPHGGGREIAVTHAPWHPDKSPQKRWPREWLREQENPWFWRGAMCRKGISWAPQRILPQTKELSRVLRKLRQGNMYRCIILSRFVFLVLSK